MTESKEVFKSVVDIISKHAKNREMIAKIDMGTNILNDLQVNSARLVDIVLDFEDLFKIEIQDDELDHIATVGDAVQLVGKKIH
jgi:acyl carrier protein